MPEKGKTIILVILILLAVGFIVYTRAGYQSNFLGSFK